MRLISHAETHCKIFLAVCGSIGRFRFQLTGHLAWEARLFR